MSTLSVTGKRSWRSHLAEFTFCAAFWAPISYLIYLNLTGAL